MILYIDISQLEKARSNTGIQRVLKEILQRLISDDQQIEIKVISHNLINNKVELLDNNEVVLFFKDIASYHFQKRKIIDIENIKVEGIHIFFDIDSVWSVELKRERLYPKLKANGFLIFNFLHDLIPIVMPEVAHEVTVMHFEPFLDAVYQHSDMVFFNSHSSKRDFLEVKATRNIQRYIPSRVVGLGADFLETNGAIDTSEIGGILEKKYLLFVGTLEPRKNQSEMLDAFEVLAEKHPNLHLVFIGREGWNVSKLARRIKNHALNGTQLHWFSGIDDNLLKQFYQNAFIVCYLSKYEGYGLPIVESLQFANITIASRNSSMLEAGRNFADYLVYNTKNELVDTISLYLENPSLYRAKKEAIKQNFNVLSWDKVYRSLIKVFYAYEKAENLKKTHTTELQFVFISISFDSIKETIKAIDKHINFVKEYIVVTSPALLKKFERIETAKKLIVIDETAILKEYAKDFQLRDHQSKNWLLRVSLLNLEQLDNEFIMLDDDNRPIKKITINHFISAEGHYNAYYYYNLLEWNHKDTAYDLGQHSTKAVLTAKNYELFSYSAHAPQIINRSILQEVASHFFAIGLQQPIDEWSIYFNYAVSLYPSLFQQKIFQTLNWPDTPLSWEYTFTPKDYAFENYYKEIYDKKIFLPSTSFQEKVDIKNKELQPHTNTRELFNKNISMLTDNNMAHGVLSFKNNKLECYLFSIPYLVVVEESSAIRLKINYKLLNPKGLKNDIVIAVLLLGKPRTFVRLQEITNEKYQEGIIEIPLVSQDLLTINKDCPVPTELLLEGMYDLSFDLIVNKKYVYATKSPYFIKLIVAKKEDMKAYPTYKPIVKKENMSFKKYLTSPKIKERIKSIPVFGRLISLLYGLLRVNRLHTQQFNLQHRLDELLCLSSRQQQQLKKQQHQFEKQQQEHQQIKNLIKYQVSSEISTQSILFQQRIEQFISESNSEESTSNKQQTLKDNAASFVLDDFYLAFENKFRGEREEIKQRYKKYLQYLTISTKTALDIGCGRAEWVGLLQNNGIKAQGIDLNFAMLNEGTRAGVKNLQKINAFDFFKSCADDSFDLITAFHIIEHIPYEQLFVFLQEIKRISTPNAIILLETPNPANLLVAAFEFYKDPTHLNPLPADVIQFTVEYMGFVNVSIEKLHPFPESMRIEEHSQTAQVLNDYLYQERDYLIIARNGKQKALEKTSTSSINKATKPKLAFISPLPPQQTGIAYYSAELLPELSQYYAIDLISTHGMVEDHWLNAHLPIRTINWFEQHYKEYDRILYHFGNSKFHIEMLDLLENIQGIVVLHDFYLNNLMAQAKRLNPNLYYQQHGYQVALDNKDSPCNQSILNQSLGVIVHSNYANKILNDWYHNSKEANWSIIPLLRVPPKNDEELFNKEQLGFPKNAFIVCSFGALRPNKQNHELLDAWKQSTLHHNEKCHLVFIGENLPDTDYGKKLEAAISKHIHITGWVDDTTFKSYLSIADIGVQLRTNSRGETSAAILDCMNHSLPTIINANGSNQELPSDTLYSLDDDFQSKDLSKALDILYTNTNSEREKLAKNSKKHIELNHNPAKCAQHYYQSIENNYKTRDSYKQRLIEELSQKNIESEELIKTITLSSFTPIRQQQILIDISSIIKNDLKTGIERVVRSQIIALIKNAPKNIRIEPIYLSTEADNVAYCYARDYTKKLLNIKGFNRFDEPIKVNKGDIFYGLDLCAREVAISVQNNLYQRYKVLGVKIVFMVYDLLPITKPHFFPPKMEKIHQHWFNHITTVADQLICISAKVAKEVETQLENTQITITPLHLGADISKDNFIAKKEKPSDKNITFLMVGTIEPRKAHQQVLQAFEQLWEKDTSVNLVIVGKTGWMMQDLQQKLQNHPKSGKNLFYLAFISDAELEQHYQEADCLIVASEDEGFGLPLIEGAMHKLPIIARDISVFREVAGDYATYFNDTLDANKLASSIENWLGKYQQNKQIKSEKMPYLTWEENAKKLLKILAY